MKKAQGLSLNTIIIAAIVLIVLIVLWAIFTGRMGKFTAGLKKEETAAQEKAKEFEKLAVGLDCRIGGAALGENEAPCECTVAPNKPICDPGEACTAGGCVPG